MGVSHFVGFRVELYQRTQTADMAYGTSVVAYASRELKLKLYMPSEVAVLCWSLYGTFCRRSRVSLLAQHSTLH